MRMKNLLIAAAIAALTLPAVADRAPLTSADIKPWPLTVPAGEVECTNNLVTFHAGGKTYAVNGSAKGYAKAKNLAWRDVREIWRDDPGVPGTKVVITPIIDRGLALCAK